MPRLVPAPLDLLAVLSIVVLVALLSSLWCMVMAGAVGGDSAGRRWVAGGAAGAVLWGWVIQQAVQIARVVRATGQRPASFPPDAATILHKYPPRRVDDAAAGRVEDSKLHRAANDAVVELLRDQIGRGRELGAQVFAYHRGRCGFLPPINACFALRLLLSPPSPLLLLLLYSLLFTATCFAPQASSRGSWRCLPTDGYAALAITVV